MPAYQEGSIKEIKLVIWDLDETFWIGTVDDGDNVVIPEEHIQLVCEFTDCGIVNAICSKNEKDNVTRLLEKYNLEQYFVCNSIDWTPKGARIKNMLQDMGLRSVNTLFIDDNHLNLEEVEFTVPGIKTASPEIISKLADEIKRTPLKKDLEHKRLKQYKLIEKKIEDRGKYDSNQEFLMSCNIQVNVQQACMDELERVYELVLRANQLNYTKKRSSKEELKALLEDPDTQSATIYVKDRFGDYGMVGFYALQGDELIHFLFSCRTIGMGIEQYVYAQIGYPRIEIVGDVLVTLDDAKVPTWINRNEAVYTGGADGINGSKHSVLIKGPCDMEQIFNFIKKNSVIDSEFTHVNIETGVDVQSINHTMHIVQAVTLSANEKKKIIEEVPFSSEDFFETDMFSGRYKYVFLSTLHDSHLGIYRRKDSGIKVVFGEAKYPMTEPENFSKYINEEIYTSNCKLQEEFLKKFSNDYEFCGITSEEEFGENILFILENLPKETKLILLLGPEMSCDANKNPAFEHAHLIHARNNAVVRELAKENDRLSYICYGDYINGQDGFYNNIYHFRPSVYYEISKEICGIINEGEKQLDVVSQKKVRDARMKQIIRGNCLVDWVITKLKKLQFIQKIRNEKRKK